jgi:nucleoside-diphosphate-sugar epimerase
MRILVTGASGFIGRVTCAELLGRGHDVSALVRRPGSEPPSTTPVLGDVTAGALNAVVAQAGPEAVVHLAAEIATQRDEAIIEAVNIGGTKRLVEACQALAGDGPRIIFASTVVTGDARGAILDERTPLPIQTPYGRSKQAGERLVLESGLPAIVVRPSHVYGAGGWFAEEIVARLKQPGRFAVVGRGDNLWDVVRVEDVAAALADAAERARPGETFHVVDDEPLSCYDFVALAAQALGIGPPRRVPVALARLVAGPNAVLAVTRSARSSNAKLKHELGWTPRFATARVGVPDAIAALAARALLLRTGGAVDAAAVEHAA